MSGKIKADLVVDASTISWITDLKILGGNLGFAATIPFPIGAERTAASVAVTGPLGHTVSAVSGHPLFPLGPDKGRHTLASPRRSVGADEATE